MANIQIPNLPAAIALSGAELLEGVQAGTSVKITTQQLADMQTSAGQSAAQSAAQAAQSAIEAANSAAAALASELAAAVSETNAGAAEIASAANAATAAGSPSASVRNAAGVVNLKHLQGLAIDGLYNSCAVVDFVTTGNNYSDNIVDKVTFSRASEVRILNDLKKFATVASGEIVTAAFSPQADRWVGLQLQPQRTRLNRYCLGNTQWSAANFTVTGSQASIFSGALATSATKYVCSAGNTQKMIRISTGTLPTYTLGSTYTQQYIFKPTDITVYPWYLFQFPSARFGNARVKVDLESMTFLFSDGTVTRKSITYIGDGWYSLEMTAVASGATATGEYGRMSVADPAAASGSVSDTFAGDGINGFTFAYYGLEEGAFATTPITENDGTASVVRQADNMSLTCSVLPSFANGFSATVDLAGCPDTGAGQQVVFEIDDGTAANSIRLESGDANEGALQLVVTKSSVATTAQTESYVISTSEINRFIIVYSVSGGAVLYDENNQIIATVEAGNCPAPSVFNSGSIFFGRNRSNSNFWSFPFNMFRIFPQVFLEAERNYFLPFHYLPNDLPPEAPFKMPQGLGDVVAHLNFCSNKYYPQGLYNYFNSDQCNTRTTNAYAYSPLKNRAYLSRPGTLSRTEQGAEFCSATVNNRLNSGRNFGDLDNWTPTNMSVETSLNMTETFANCLLVSTGANATIAQTVSGFTAGDILTFWLQAVDLTGTVEISIRPGTWIDITDQLSTDSYRPFRTPMEHTAPSPAVASLRFGSSGTRILSDFACVSNGADVDPMIESLTNATGSRDGDFVSFPLEIIGFTDFSNCTVIVNAMPMTSSSGGTFWCATPAGDFDDRVTANYLGDNGASSTQLFADLISGSGTGTHATINFTGPQTYAIGTYINVYGVEPVGYNGQWIVTSSTSTSVTYACTQTGAMSFFSDSRVGYDKKGQVGLTTGESAGITEQGTDPVFPNIVRKQMNNTFVTVMNKDGLPAGQRTTLNANRVYVSLNGSTPVESSAITTWYVVTPDTFYLAVQSTGGGGGYIIIKDITIIDYPYEQYEMQQASYQALSSG